MCRLFYGGSFSIFPQLSYKELPTWLFFLSVLFLNVSLNSFSFPLAGCTEDALNPVQSSIWWHTHAHTDTGSSRSLRSPSLPCTTAHRGTSTLPDWSGGEWAASAQLELVDAAVDHPWTVRAMFFPLYFFLSGCFDSSALLSFLCPLTEIAQD